MRTCFPITLLSLSLICLPTQANARAAPATRPADEERLRALDGHDFRIHDPSTIVRSAGDYWLFATGSGVISFHSPDLQNWSRGPGVFAKPLAWFDDVAPGSRGHLWAPEVLRLDDADGERWLLYYSVSSWGKNISAIGLAVNRSLDPTDPRYGWTDGGIVVRSNAADRFNAIDPSVLRDREGRLWMAFGSFWDGIHLVELDPRSGGVKTDAAPPLRIAWKREIEAAYLHAHDGRYYLFVNWGECCKGVKSTYEIRVGRADNITGPYLDRDGVDLAKGGGTSVISSDGPMIGPGHASIFTDAAGVEQFACHFYDATHDGQPRLAIRPLTWDRQGWAFVGDIRKPSTDPSRK